MLSRFSCVQLCVILWMVRFLFHGILQVRLLQWIAMPSFRGSSWPRIEPASLMSPALAGRFFTTSTTWEDQTHGYRGKRGRYIGKLGLCDPSMCMLVCMCVSHTVVSNSLQPHGLKPARLLCPWGFSRQECWSGLPFPSPGNLPDPGIIKPGSPVLQVFTLPSEPYYIPHTHYNI